MCRYFTQLFYGSDPNKEMSYNAHLHAIAAAFAANFVKTGKKTHSTRASGAQDTANAG